MKKFLKKRRPMNLLKHSSSYSLGSSKLNLTEEEHINNSVPSFDGVEPQQNATPRVGCVQRGKKGFGFVLRGARSPQGGAVSFTPTKDFPALQYLEHVDKGSPADRAGLKMGDFILEINGEDVTAAPHQYVVNLVVNSPDTIVMKVITVPGSKAYSWLKDGGGTLKRPGPSVSVNPPTTRSMSVASPVQKAVGPSISVNPPTTKSMSIASPEQKAVDELDMAIESGNKTPKYVSPASSRSSSIQGDEPRVASIRKRPIRHQVSQQHLEGIFQRQGSSSTEGTLNSMPDNANIQKPTVPVPPSCKYNTVARISNAKASRQPSYDEMHSPNDRRNSGGSDSAVSSLRSSPTSSNSFMTSSTMSVTDSAVHLKAERTTSDPSLAVDMQDVSPKSLPGNVKKPSPLPPTRSQSLLNLSVMNSGGSSPDMRHVGNEMQTDGVLSASKNTMAIEVQIDVHRPASGNESSDDASSTSSFASAIALAAAHMEKKKGSTEEKPKSSSPFEMAMAAKQNYTQMSSEGPNLNRNQNQNVENPSSTQVALQQAIAKRKVKLENSGESKSGDIEDRIRWYKQQDKVSRPKTGQAAFLDAIAKRRSIVDTQNPSSEDDSSSESTPNSPMNRIQPVRSSHNQKTRNESNTIPLGSEIAKAASAMQDKIANRPPIKEGSGLNRHKNVIRISPRNRNEDSTDSSDSDAAPSVSVKNLKQSFEKSKKLSPRDAKVSPLSPVKEDETLPDLPIPPPAAFLESNGSIPLPRVDVGCEETPHKNGNLLDEFQKDSHHMDIDIVPPPPSFVEDGDQGRYRREQPFDTASVVSSASSISTMSSYSTMSTDPSSNDGFEPIGEEIHSNSNTLRSDASSSGSSTSTLTTMSTGETNDNWAKTAPPVATKPSKKRPTNDNEISHGMSNGNDNEPLKGKSVSAWSVDDVCMWLDRLQLGEYRGNFTDNAISGEHLTALGKDDLSELGVKRLGHRLTIIKALQKLKI